MLIAITRAVSKSILNCELTHLERVPINLGKARQQHLDYENALIQMGLNVHSLPEEPDLPDSVFVEDTAVVLDEYAILTRPGADSRKPEVESIANALRPYRKLLRIHSPGTLDGGDVLVVGRDIWVGLSERSNQQAVDQLRKLLDSAGYNVHGVKVTGCLHLKSAVTQAAPGILLINPNWIRKEEFPGLDFIDVDPSEPGAGNILFVGETTLYQPTFPKTLSRLRAEGIHPLLVDASEFAKAEGALTCCSIIFEGKNE